MRSVFVTNENIRVLKRSLREELVGVKSGHITEALAQGVGYKTQAAMLADVNSTHPFRPILRHLCAYRMNRPGFTGEILFQRLGDLIKGA